ncbi:MAG: hypothetical protein HYY22_09710 [Thaumarchaeota archaeon]|nr:hypothetical protein [Nitrososphaerota archaeon]
MGDKVSRHSEWYVPRFGPLWVRTIIGLTFWPYTMMNLSYVIIGSMLSAQVDWYRVLLISAVYMLALGVAAHALDARAPNKPWASYLSDKQLLLLAASALAPAVVISTYLVETATFLIVIAVLEAFFLFAYNAELFSGRFHNDWWFAFSWGVLPTLAGYFNLSSQISALPFLAAALTGFTAVVEISASRPYKNYKKTLQASSSSPTILERYTVKMLERILKFLVATVCGTAALSILARMILL